MLQFEDPQGIVIPKRGIFADTAGFGMTRSGVVAASSTSLPFASLITHAGWRIMNSCQPSLSLLPARVCGESA
jgi:hypothetical protein